MTHHAHRHLVLHGRLGLPGNRSCLQSGAEGSAREGRQISLEHPLNRWHWNGLAFATVHPTFTEIMARPILS
jgi:hypothetical protein